MESNINLDNLGAANEYAEDEGGVAAKLHAELQAEMPSLSSEGDCLSSSDDENGKKDRKRKLDKAKQKQLGKKSLQSRSQSACKEKDKTAEENVQLHAPATDDKRVEGNQAEVQSSIQSAKATGARPKIKGNAPSSEGKSSFGKFQPSDAKELKKTCRSEEEIIIDAKLEEDFSFPSHRHRISSFSGARFREEAYGVHSVPLSIELSTNIDELRLDLEHLQTWMRNKELEWPSITLERAQKLITHLYHDNSYFASKEDMWRKRYEDEEAEKVHAVCKLASAESAIESLNCELNELRTSKLSASVGERSEKLLQDLQTHHEKEVGDLRKRIDELQEHCDFKQKELLSTQEALEKLKAEKGQRFAQAQLLDARIDELERVFNARTEELCEEEKRTKNENFILKRKIQQLDADLNNLGKERDSLKKNCAGLENEVQELKEHKLQGKGKFCIGKSKKEIQLQAEALKQKYEDLLREASGLERKLKEKEKEKENAEKEKIDIEQKMRREAKQKTAAELRNISLETQLKEKQKMEEIFQKEKKDFEQRLREKEREKDTLQKKKSTLERQLREKQSENEREKFSLQLKLEVKQEEQEMIEGQKRVLDREVKKMEKKNAEKEMEISLLKGKLQQVEKKCSCQEASTHQDISLAVKFCSDVKDMWHELCSSIDVPESEGEKGIHRQFMNMAELFQKKFLCYCQVEMSKCLSQEVKQIEKQYEVKLQKYVESHHKMLLVVKKTCEEFIKKHEEELRKKHNRAKLEAYMHDRYLLQQRFEKFEKSVKASKNSQKTDKVTNVNVANTVEMQGEQATSSISQKESLAVKKMCGSKNVSVQTTTTCLPSRADSTTKVIPIRKSYVVPRKITQKSNASNDRNTEQSRVHSVRELSKMSEIRGASSMAEQSAHVSSHRPILKSISSGSAAVSLRDQKPQSSQHGHHIQCKSPSTVVSAELQKTKAAKLEELAKKTEASSKTVQSEQSAHSVPGRKPVRGSGLGPHRAH